MGKVSVATLSQILLESVHFGRYSDALSESDDMIQQLNRPSQGFQVFFKILVPAHCCGVLIPKLPDERDV